MEKFKLSDKKIDQWSFYKEQTLVEPAALSQHVSKGQRLISITGVFLLMQSVDALLPFQACKRSHAPPRKRAFHSKFCYNCHNTVIFLTNSKHIVLNRSIVS